MNKPRTATVEGFGQAKNSRALAYLSARSWVGKIEGLALIAEIPPTVSDRQAIDFMWHAFNFPQTLDGWCVITEVTSPYDEARNAISAGTAVARALWVLLSAESDRDGFALKPMPWEGPGEYQHVIFGNGRNGFVKVSGERKHLTTSPHNVNPVAPDTAAKMRAGVLKFAEVLETEGSFVSARVFRELGDLPDESMITLRKALDHVQA